MRGMDWLRPYSNYVALVIHGWGKDTSDVHTETPKNKNYALEMFQK
jgi:hypothetical protein